MQKIRDTIQMIRMGLKIARFMHKKKLWGKALDFSGKELTCGYFTQEDETIKQAKLVIKHLPDLINFFIPNVSNAKLTQPEAIFIRNLREVTLLNLKTNEINIQDFMKDEGGADWDAQDDMEAIGKLFDVLAVVVNSDNYPRSVWMGILYRLWEFHDRNSKKYLKEHGKELLPELVKEQNHYNNLIAESWLKQKTGRNVTITRNKNKEFIIKENKGGVDIGRHRFTV
jgi:hypothetical protein